MNAVVGKKERENKMPEEIKWNSCIMEYFLCYLTCLTRNATVNDDHHHEHDQHDGMWGKI